MMPMMRKVHEVLSQRKKLGNRMHPLVLTRPVILLVISLPSRMTVVSPQREKKRTFAQAELEEVGPVTVDTEDNMRRKQGPPKVVDVSLECQQRETGTGQECHHTANCQERQTGAVSRKHESKDGSGVSEAAYAENERLEQEGPQLCTPGTACCKAQPVQNRIV